MGRAKEIVIKVIPSSIANPFIKKHHYSAKVVHNSQVHFGAFLDGRLHGVISFGPSMDKKKLQGLVKGTEWNGFIELNRLAFDEHLPKNSESRCISIALKMLKRNAPHIKWVISFADGTQCGDGTIYRASGFLLTSIKRNKQTLKLPDGSIASNMTLTKGKHILKTGSAGRPEGSEYLDGFQLRYIYFLDPSKQNDLAVPILPYSAIDLAGAGMYKGERISLSSRRALKA